MKGCWPIPAAREFIAYAQDTLILTIVRAAHVGVVALKHCGTNGLTGECERVPAFVGLSARFSTR